MFHLSQTTNERYMWKYPYDQDERTKLLFQVPCQWNNGVHNISRIKVWNYNKKMKVMSQAMDELPLFSFLFFFFFFFFFFFRNLNYLHFAIFSVGFSCRS